MKSRMLLTIKLDKKMYDSFFIKRKMKELKNSRNNKVQSNGCYNGKSIIINIIGRTRDD